MTKLTVAMRDTIVANAVEKAGVNKQMAEYNQRRKAWAEKVADESIGGAEVLAKLSEANRKIAKIVAGLPESLRTELRVGPNKGSIFAAFGGMRIRCNEWDGYRPACDNMMLTADHPLSIEFEALESERKSIDERKNRLQHDVRAMLHSVSTIKRLIDLWPEAAELLPTYAKATPQLPSVNVEALNAAIGLPTEETPQ